MNTIHISIQAYNAEKTLERAINSILAQTYKDYVIYVCENGSTDNTRAIVDDYAAKGLILPYYNEKNMVYEGKSIEFVELCKNIADDDFYAQLDADDELYPDFFEELLNFANENDLDIAAAEYEHYDLKTNTKYVPSIFENKKTNNIFYSADDYKNDVVSLFGHFFTVWGKLYKGNVSGELYVKSLNFSVGADTVLVLKAITKARRVGILPKLLMLYYTGGQTYSRSYDKNRIYMPEAFYNATADLLRVKTGGGSIGAFEYKMSYQSFFYSVNDMLFSHLKLDIPLETKINEIVFLIGHKYFRKVFTQIDSYKMFRINALYSQPIVQCLIWILDNIKIIPFERLCELYYLFFEVIYQSKEPKFTEKEIDYLLEFDTRLVNGVLIGDFDNAEKWFANIPVDFMSRRVMRKMRELKV
jgi:glycosyltransferase involved in cell wall biosynthesis